MVYGVCLMAYSLWRTSSIAHIHNPQNVYYVFSVQSNGYSVFNQCLFFCPVPSPRRCERVKFQIKTILCRNVLFCFRFGLGWHAFALQTMLKDLKIMTEMKKIKKKVPEHFEL